MEEPEKNGHRSRDIILRYGLISGGATILYAAVLYLIDPGLIFGYYGYIGVAIAFALAVAAAVARRKNNGGYISYGDSVVTSLATFSISSAIYTIYMLLMYFVIDPRLIDKMKSLQMDKLDEYAAKGSLSKVQLAAAQARIEGMDSNTILFYSIMGLI